LEIGGLDGKGYPFALFGAFLLERRSRSQRGVKGQVIGFTIGWARLDVTAAFAGRDGTRAPAGVPPGEFI
jgi:hypothetical protein